jgi:hypothetical protein
VLTALRRRRLVTSSAPKSDPRRRTWQLTRSGQDLVDRNGVAVRRSSRPACRRPNVACFWICSNGCSSLRKHYARRKRWHDRRHGSTARVWPQRRGVHRRQPTTGC